MFPEAASEDSALSLECALDAERSSAIPWSSAHRRWRGLRLPRVGPFGVVVARATPESCVVAGGGTVMIWDARWET